MSKRQREAEERRIREARKRFVSSEARDLAYYIMSQTRFKASDFREIRDGTGDIFLEDHVSSKLVIPIQLKLLGEAGVTIEPYDDSQVPGDQRPTLRFSMCWAEKNMGVKE